MVHLYNTIGFRFRNKKQLTFENHRQIDGHRKINPE